MIRKLLLPFLLAFTIPASADSVPATVETTGSGVTTTVLDDKTTIVTFLSSGTITLGDDAHVSRVLVSETENEMFAGLIGAGAGKYTIAIDPASPFFRTGRTRTVTLVAWKGGVDMDHVTFAEPPEGVEVFYTYGWPSVLTEPETAGDLPTVIRANLRGYGSTVLIVR